MYAKYANNEDWVDGFLTMVDKINDSKKFSVAQKFEKIEALYEVNDFIIGMIKEESKGLYEVLSTGIGKVKQELTLALRDGNQT